MNGVREPIASPTHAHPAAVGYVSHRARDQHDAADHGAERQHAQEDFSSGEEKPNEESKADDKEKNADLGFAPLRHSRCAPADLLRELRILLIEVSFYFFEDALFVLGKRHSPPSIDIGSVFKGSSPSSIFARLAHRGNALWMVESPRIGVGGRIPPLSSPIIEPGFESGIDPRLEQSRRADRPVPEPPADLVYGRRRFAPSRAAGAR